MKSTFINKLLCQPWDISREKGRTIISGIMELIRSERPAESIFGEPLPKMRIEGDTAIVPICGVIMLAVPEWVKDYGFGITDANDIAEELAEAVNNPEVARIVLDFNSPGGDSHAGYKLVDAVTAAARKKPVMSWCADGSQMCSAAYNAACPSDFIATGPYSIVGSVGSYLVALDDSEYWKMLGFKWEVFRSGEIKGIGEDGISDEQKTFLQDMVDKSGDRFRANVKKYRSAIDPADLRGQWYLGDEAATRGFTHALAPNFNAALAKFRRLAA